MDANRLERRRHSDPLHLAPSGIPARYVGLTFDTIATPAIREVTREYLLHFWALANAGLAPVFLGQAGTYKTYAAAFIAASINHRAQLDVAFVQCGPEFQELEQTRFDPRTPARLRYLDVVPFLVLDDFAKVKPGSLGLDLLDALVERRYANQLPTLYTANVVVSATDYTPLINQFGVGFTRRLRETSTGLVVVATE